MALSDIDTIIIVIMENRSFDHILGYLSLPTTPNPMPVDGLSSDPDWIAAHANLNAGATYACQPLAPDVQTISDPAHDHLSISMQITIPPADAALPGMGGFAQSYATYSSPTPADPGLVMGYYDQTAVPVFDFFARHFVVCDHWFASLPLGTQANRFMAMAGESPIVDNASVFLPDQKLVYDWLTEQKVRWCAYQSGGFFPFFSLMPDWLPEIATSLTLSALGGRGRFRRYAKFADEWRSPDPMPSVIFIEPEYTDGPHSSPNDDHPPTGVAPGQAFLADIYQTLISNSARWAKAMMVVTYDEHGGFFDHIPPLPIPAQVNNRPFATTGVRVPAFVISPQVAAGQVFNGDLDHTSILQLLDDRFARGQGYSLAVNARQAYLQRLAGLLQPPEALVRAPALSSAVLAQINAAASAPPVSSPTGASANDPANAQALHKVALKIADDHPDLLAQPGWEAVADYVGRTA